MDRTLKVAGALLVVCLSLPQVASAQTEEWMGTALTSASSSAVLITYDDYLYPQAIDLPQARDLIVVDTPVWVSDADSLAVFQADIRELFLTAEELVPKGRSRDWHNALMDYGATFLTARKSGIKPKTKQSKFKGSPRYYRGKIIKALIAQPQSTSQLQTTLEKEDIQSILEGLKNEELIIEKEGKWQIN